MFYFYILKSKNSARYYAGSTENIAQRLEKHNSGRVPSTKYGWPWELVYSKEFYSLREARKREIQIKKWKSRTAIEKLIKNI